MTWKCPECRKEIDSVAVKSYCWQTAFVAEDGVVVHWSSVEDIEGECVDAICLECGASVRSHIKFGV